MSAPDKTKKINELLSEFKKVSEFFESEEIDIDSGIQQYEKGMKLAHEIKQQLEKYEAKIQQIQEKYSQESPQ